MSAKEPEERRNDRFGRGGKDGERERGSGAPRRPSGGGKRDGGGYRGSRPVGDKPEGGGYRGSRPVGDKPDRGGYRGARPSGSSSRGSYSGDRYGGDRARESQARSGPYRNDFRGKEAPSSGGYRERGRPVERSNRPQPPARRPQRRWEEPGISDHEGAFSTEDASSLSRAANTGRNLWNPVPSRARKPGSAPGFQPQRYSGPRRSTNSVGGEQVEGRQAVRELLAGKRSVSEVWLIEGSDPSPILGEIDNLARKRHVPVRMVSPRKLESVQRTDTPQGVVAFAEPLDSHDLTELVLGGRGLAGEGAAFLVVVDGVTDPHNLGAILRSAECAGATGAVLPRHRAVHVTAAVTKAAAGAIEHLPICLVAGIPSALQELERLGVRTVGLDERGETSLFDLGLDFRSEPVALVLGAEGRGLSPLSRRRCEVLANIPLHGQIPSLNVSTAAAVACFEVARARTKASSKTVNGGQG
ncbi:MAG: 23S rRNA (guanosine(2251)-2'-O)-methyltransferase RlmB [Acidimicrobiales bacterium]